MTFELQQALQVHQQGRVADAIALYEQILGADPQNHDALHYLGVAFRQSGRAAEAVGLLERAIGIRPDSAAVHNNLGNAYLALDQLDRALESFDHAIRLTPQYAMAHNNRGIVLVRLGRHEEALSAYLQVARLEPRHADIFYNMGVVLQALERFGEASDQYQEAIDRAPAFFEAWVNQASAFIRQGRFDSALAASERSLGLQPESPEAHHNRGLALAGLKRAAEAFQAQESAVRLRAAYGPAWIARGDVLMDLQRTNEALESYRQATAIEPQSLPARMGQGRALNELKRHEEALKNLEQAVRIDPGNALAWLNCGYAYSAMHLHAKALECVDQGLLLGVQTAQACSHRGHALFHLGRSKEAAASYRNALTLAPDDADIHCNLGLALMELNEPELAVAHYEKALALNPGYADVYSNLGTAEQLLGHPEAALAHYEKALILEPGNALAYSNKLFLLAYNALSSTGEYLQQARGWEHVVVGAAELRAARNRTFHRPPRAGRRLKIGYVSGDFRRHPVSYFVEQLFARHDRELVEVHAYYINSVEDETTARLRGLADRWVALPALSDAAARDRIEADGIDVLIDLSGHSSPARPGIFARRAAPVQAEYLGYFASTGLTEMDYWIGDEEITPAAMDGDFSERLWRLPRVWMGYNGRADAASVDWHPRQDGAIVFGTFNSLRKLMPKTLSLWARILNAVPEGRLLLKTRELAVEDSRRRLLRFMQDAGVAPQRIELLDGSATPDWRSHMDAYNRLDVALDPIGGMGGATTTCGALWMGVPVIALAGDRMAARPAASMLVAAGHREWVAADEGDYVAKAVALARDVGLRTTLRPGARRRMAESPLCDGLGLARQLEAAYAEMYDRHASPAGGGA